MLCVPVQCSGGAWQCILVHQCLWYINVYLYIVGTGHCSLLSLHKCPRDAPTTRITPGTLSHTNFLWAIIQIIQMKNKTMTKETQGLRWHTNIYMVLGKVCKLREGLQYQNTGIAYLRLTPPTPQSRHPERFGPYKCVNATRNIFSTKVHKSHVWEWTC